MLWHFDQCSGIVKEPMYDRIQTDVRSETNRCAIRNEPIFDLYYYYRTYSTFESRNLRHSMWQGTSEASEKVEALK